MTTSHDFNSWATLFQVNDGSVTPTDDGVTIAFDGPQAHPRLRIPPLSDECGSAVVSVDPGPLSRLNISGGAPEVSVAVVCDRRLSSVGVEGSLGSLSLRNMDGSSTQVNAGATRRLILSGGSYTLGRGAIGHLVVQDCAISGSQGMPEISLLKVVGTVGFVESSWAVDQLDLSAAPSFTVDARFEARALILPHGDEEATLHGEFHFGPDHRLGSIAKPGRLFLADGAAVTLVGSASHLVFTGRGRVVVSDELVSSHFSGEEVSVECARGARLLDASGTIQNLMAVAATATGKSSDPIRPLTLSSVQGAALFNVDCFGLAEESLDALEQCAQFAPWVPSKAGSAVKQLRSMRLSAHNPGEAVEDGVTDEWRSARFWQRVTRLSADSQASGNTQSQARYVYAAARRYASESRRERFLLWVYSLIGYGERVLRPIGLYVVVVMLAWVGLRFGPFSVADSYPLGDMFGLPLQTFRVVGESSLDRIEGVVRWVLVFVQLFGLLMLFFSLSAVRRISKAE